MDQPDGQRCGCRDLAHHVGSGVGAVVDEDDLRVDAARLFRDTTNELRDIGSLVVGRDDDRQLH
jgi:hypothetical protein